VAPAVKLYDFQGRWLADKSRFKIGLMSRQIGKSFTVALEVVNDALETGKDWILLSAGERQSKELMEKVKMHCKAYMLAAADIQISSFDTDSAKYTMLTITLPNGARIIGLPANPDTARGFSANVVLDEFAFHKDSDKIWAALFPTISRGFKIRIISTPQGMGNRFHRLCTADNGWSKHVVDIYQAVADGVPHNVEELKAGIDDPDAWAQEFEVQFIDEASAWLTYEMIAACQLDSIPKEIEYSDLNDQMLEKIALSIQGRSFGGFDIARRKDLTVLDIEDQIGDVYWNRATILFPKVRLTTQKEMLWKIMDRINLERICIDSTGLGLSLGEDTVDKYGSYRAEKIEFTLKIKQDLAVRTRNIFEDRRTRISLCQKLRDDLHAVKKTTTAAGNVRFDAEHTDKGHADRFWAKSLAYMASDEGTEKPEVICLG
ncbi:MAG TPA: terminase, partial [Phycisphaerales bacterium]|nr:terminase [Phycisphaerales bacterium]